MTTSQTKQPFVKVTRVSGEVAYINLSGVDVIYRSPHAKETLIIFKNDDVEVGTVAARETPEEILGHYASKVRESDLPVYEMSKDDVTLIQEALRCVFTESTYTFCLTEDIRARELCERFATAYTAFILEDK